MDKSLAFVIIWIALFWMVMVSSVSVYTSYLLTSSQVARWLSDNISNSFYLIRNVIYFIISLPVFFIASRIPYTFWKKTASWFFLIAIFLLILVFIPWLTNEYWTSQSWLNIPFLPSIQPAEVMKVALIFYFSLWLESKTNKISTLKHWFAPFAILIFLIVLLLGLQPDFGSVLVISCIAWSMFFVAWWNLWHIFWALIIWVVAATPVILTHEYIRNRFAAFINPDFDTGWAWYQIKQALITIWSWQWFWVWFWQSVQKFWYLPEVQWDTIFAIAAEELWFIRMVLFILCYLFIAYKWYQIANKAPDRFSMLLATWITSLIIFQSFINIWVNTAILPLTWLTLPFVSYWWSSLITMMFAAWILLWISRYTHK